MSLPSIFNCSNDMALAANVRQYRPPKRVELMEAELAELARVWEGTRMAGPWGWSLATKWRYKRMGVAEELLPSDEWLAEVRRLSSRKFACEYVRELLGELGDARLLGDEMQWVERKRDGMEKGLEGNAERGGHEDGSEVCGEMKKWIFKSPWSSSGRGVFVGSWCDERIRTRVQGVLSSQGGVAVDRFYADKVSDFAMEFFIHDDHAVEFLGYSVFHAAESGVYGYNYVESQEALLRRIGTDESLLRRLINFHQKRLARLSYRGPVGIDMLKTAAGCIHPCIEINLRMNMGILALLLYEKYGLNATVALTPAREHGFQALVEEGRLQIIFSK